MATFNRPYDRIKHAGEDAKSMVQRSRWSIGSILLLGLLVAFGIWVWPEARRTAHIHRM